MLAPLLVLFEIFCFCFSFVPYSYLHNLSIILLYGFLRTVLRFLGNEARRK